MSRRITALGLGLLAGLTAAAGLMSVQARGGDPAGSETSQAKTPQFNDFRVRERFRGNAVPVQLLTRQARTYRTVLREGAKKGPNFAGHYTIVTWGCGSSCIQFAIVDARTGRVYFPPFYVAFGSNLRGKSLRDREPLRFRRDSRLLIVTGSRNEKGEGVYFYEWVNGTLKLIRAQARA
jgi:hypothetical protein